jgi:ligand-binding SRPBCC domain-containing protein
MSLHHLAASQVVPLSIEDAWSFFSDPRNLAIITPPDMGFLIHTPLPDRMYAGMLIEYTVRPAFNIPVRWVTEITHVRDHEYFVDEQRAGPYSFWHHEHHFRPVAGGVETIDLVSYRLPLGPLGDLANRLVVASRLAHIFEFRRKVLAERFGTLPSAGEPATGGIAVQAATA